MWKYTVSRLNRSMEKYPILSNSVLCLNLFIAGDLCAQYSEHRYLQDDQRPEKREEDGQITTTTTNTTTTTTTVFTNTPPAGGWDLQRVAQCAFYGATVTGPILALWYPFMEQLCVRYNITSRYYGPWAAPIVKVLADEFVLDPPCLVSFFVWMNLCEGGDMTSLQNKLQTQFFPSWTASLAVWPIVLLGTFRFAPVYAQAPIISVCCIGWDGYLSYRNTLSTTTTMKHRTNDQDKRTDAGLQTNDDRTEVLSSKKTTTPVFSCTVA